MTELSFLIELLLNHELPKPTKDALAERIKEVEQTLIARPMIQQQVISAPPNPVTNKFAQSPSTLALMAKHGELPPAVDPNNLPPVVAVAQNAVTIAALQERQAKISASLNNSSIVDKATGRPRKW